MAPKAFTNELQDEISNPLFGFPRYLSTLKFGRNQDLCYTSLYFLKSEHLTTLVPSHPQFHLPLFQLLAVNCGLKY